MIDTIETPMTDSTTFRDRKKLAGMRQIQSAALDLFEARGFDAVTVEEIAAVAGVSAPTVYRQFGTKEQLVLWDEYDPSLFAAIRDRLAVEPPMAAVRHGLVGTLDKIYAEDAGRILRRSRLIGTDPGLKAASAAGTAKMREQLGPYADGLAVYRQLVQRLEILAAVLIAIFHASAEEWLRTGGKFSLRSIFDEVFERLPQLTAS